MKRKVQVKINIFYAEPTLNVAPRTSRCCVTSRRQPKMIQLSTKAQYASRKMFSSSFMLNYMTACIQSYPLHMSGSQKQNEINKIVFQTDCGRPCCTTVNDFDFSGADEIITWKRLLYTDSTISFLFGRKRTVNRLWRHIAVDCTLNLIHIMSRTL